MTRVRVLTPEGRGAIAVVEVAGPDSAHLVDRWFDGTRPLAGAPIDSTRFGRWRREGSAAGEEVVAVRTADDRVEVHCHGGAAAAAAIVAALVGDGASPAKAPRPRSIVEEALALLPQAPTERVAGVLLDQANGALEDAVRSILADIESGEPTRPATAVSELLGRARLGLRLTEPWRVVVAGEPNVGKSSLVNALVGYDRAIVYDQPGTTRDVVTTATAIGGWPVTLADTAGVRDTPDPLEAAGVALARETLRPADVVVIVREAATFGAPAAVAARERLLAEVTDASILDAASKADLAPAATHYPPGVVATAAPQGAGVAELLSAIEQAIAPESLVPGVAIPFLQRHVELLGDAADRLSAHNRQGAKAALLSLLSSDRP